MDRIYDLLDSAAKRHRIKALAPRLDKAESTIRNELTRQPGYKLGISTAVLIMQITGDLSALDAIENKFNRVAFELPAIPPATPAPLMAKVARLSKEFSEVIQAIGFSMKDNSLDEEEIQRCSKETRDLIEVCVELQAFFDHLLTAYRSK